MRSAAPTQARYATILLQSGLVLIAVRLFQPRPTPEAAFYS